MNWQEITETNKPAPGTWVLITDGTDWVRARVTKNFEFEEKENDTMVYWPGITHFCNVELPK